MTYNEEIKKYYSEWWENPKDIRNVVFESLNQYVRQRIPPSEGGEALDLGSGHGKIVSYLLEKGYKVTAVEFSEEFAAELKTKFPSIRVISEDVCDIDFDKKFDIATCIELLPMIDKKKQLPLLTKLATLTKLLLINTSNSNSLHARWVEFRKWRNPFISTHTPEEFDRILEKAGFEIVHRTGIGLIIPLSLFKNFGGKFIPIHMAKFINAKLDAYFPKICHLHYVEAISKKL